MSNDDITFESEPDLDPVIQTAARVLAREVERPDEEVILAYLSGTASESDVRRVREALYRSPELRHELPEIALELGELEAAGLESRYDAALATWRKVARRAAMRETRSRVPDLARLGEWLARLRTRPAFVPSLATAMLLVLLAYPAWQFLRPMGDAPVAFETDADPGGRILLPLFLRHDRDLNLRGGELPPAPTIGVASSGTVIGLTLQAPPEAREGELFDLSVRWVGDALWRSDRPRAVVLSDGELSLPLLLNAERLRGGEVIVEAEESNPPPEREPRMARYRFQVEAAPGKR